MINCPEMITDKSGSRKLRLHVRLSGAHAFIEAGLDEVQRVLHHCFVLVFSPAQLVRAGGPAAVAAQFHQVFARQLGGCGFQGLDAGVQVLRVARVGDPHRHVRAQHAALPENFRCQEVGTLLFVGVVEDEALLLDRVVAGRHRHRLAVAALHQFELPLVHGLAHGVVDEAFREGLL